MVRFANIEESDLRFILEVNNFRIPPWTYEASGDTWKEVVIFGKIMDSCGKVFEGDTRSLLRKVVEKHSDIGIPKCGAETGFFIFKDIECSQTYL